MATNKIELFIVDRDPIFRLGLSVALEAFPDLVIIDLEDSAIATLGKLAQGMIPDILAIDVNLTDFDNDDFTIKDFIQRLKQTYPQLPIFLLASNLSDRELNLFKNLECAGYIAKGSSIETIVYALRDVAQGKSYWQIELNSHSNSGWLQNTLYHLTEPGKQQIDQDIEKIITQLKAGNLSPVNKLFLLGRKRELTIARWLANRFYSGDNNSFNNQSNLTKALPKSDQNNAKLPPKLMLAVIDDNRVISKVFNQVITKISFGTVNNTEFFLEIDILQYKKKQELIYFILEIFNEIITSIPVEAELDSHLFLQELWKKCTIDFLLTNYEKSINFDKQQLELMLQQELESIQKELLSYIYLLEDLLNYLIKGQSINIDNILYRHESPEAINRAVILLENLLIHLANAVIQVILNNFADLEVFKYNLYDPSYRSSREIARFRNEISWRYRQDNYFEHPRNIFESRYRFFRLHNGKIETLYIYASRTEELYQLQGLSWFTTIILELRDALSPRLQSIFALAGTSVVFILTQVIGRGIGLIAKGILQGIGTSFQDVRGNKK